MRASRFKQIIFPSMRRRPLSRPPSAGLAGLSLVLLACGSSPQDDGSKTKLPAMASRKPGGPHPYVVGLDSVQRYLTVANECAQAALAGLP